MEQENKKSRILCIKSFLDNESDEQHQVTMDDIIKYLESEV